MFETCLTHLLLGLKHLLLRGATICCRKSRCAAIPQYKSGIDRRRPHNSFPPGHADDGPTRSAATFHFSLFALDYAEDHTNLLPAQHQSAATHQQPPNLLHAAVALQSPCARLQKLLQASRATPTAVLPGQVHITERGRRFNCPRRLRVHPMV